MNVMTSSAGGRRILKSMVALAFAGFSVSVVAADMPASHTAEVAAAQDGGAPGSTVAQLQQLIADHQLTELRTTYNGTYGASELFQADKLNYFIALFHDKVFWRVIRTDSVKDADSIYHTFAAQTEQLAQVDIDALRLAAGKTYAQKMVAMNEQRLQNLQQDAARRRQQSQQVAVMQQQARQQAVSLSTDLRATSSQLDSVQEHIDQLEKQQNDPALDLPAPPPASSQAPAAEPAAPVQAPSDNGVAPNSPAA